MLCAGDGNLMKDSTILRTLLDIFEHFCKGKNVYKEFKESLDFVLKELI